MSIRVTYEILPVPQAPVTAAVVRVGEPEILPERPVEPFSAAQEEAFAAIRGRVARRARTKREK